MDTPIPGKNGLVSQPQCHTIQAFKGTHDTTWRRDIMTAKSETPSSRKAGAQTFIKTLVLRNPGIEIDALVQQVEKADYIVTRSTVLTLRATVLDTLKVMHAMKLTNIPSVPVRPKPKPKAKSKAKAKTEKEAA